MNQITAAVVYANMTVLHSSGKSVSSIQHLFHTRLVICACIPLSQGKLGNNKVFVQLYTKFYDFKMYTAAQSCVVISRVHTYMPLHK